MDGGCSASSPTELSNGAALLDGGASIFLANLPSCENFSSTVISSNLAINTDTLRAQNMELGSFFNQVTADLTPLNAKKVAVIFDVFKIGGLIPIKAPGRARGELEITYLDQDLR